MQHPLWKTLDLRLATGQPLLGDAPVKLHCPMHADPGASLLVYPDHCHCMGCPPHGRFVRQQAGLALVLGLWDGAPETELAAVRAVRGRIAEFQAAYPRQGIAPHVAVPLDPSAPQTFHRYLFSCPERLQELLRWRGFDEETLLRYEMGWSGSHFTFPIYTREGRLVGLRFRAPEGAGGESKYEGLAGHNNTELFSLPQFAHVSSIQELWITEGEFDASAVDQMARPYNREGYVIRSLTQTNGAGQLPGIVDAWAHLCIPVERFILATDQDEAGEQAAWAIAQKLSSHPSVVRARWPRVKDMNALLVAGGSLKDTRVVYFKQPRIFA